ncbi:unnamed protein product, partial [marine sediment metagenome]
PDNPVHKIQYRMLANLYLLMDKLEKVKLEKLEDKLDNGFLEYYRTARWFFDRALHSCWLWWASMRPMWSPSLVYKGVHLLIITALNAQLAIVEAKVGGQEYFLAEQLYKNLINSQEDLLSALVSQTAKREKLRTF